MYRGRIEKDFNIWVAKRMLSAETAKAMLAEYDLRETVFSAGRVLLILAAVLLSAAILLLVAANWEAIPALSASAVSSPLSGPSICPLLCAWGAAGAAWVPPFSFWEP